MSPGWINLGWSVRCGVWGPAPSSLELQCCGCCEVSQSVCKPACCVYLHCIAFGSFSTPDKSVTPGSKLLCYWKYLNIKIYGTFFCCCFCHHHSNSTHRIWGGWWDNRLFEWQVFMCLRSLSASWGCWVGGACQTRLWSRVLAGANDRVSVLVFSPRRGAVWCLFFLSLWNIYYVFYSCGQTPSMSSDTKPVTSAACDSPHKASAAPALFCSSYLRKVESIVCVVRWISRLYSLQYSPWTPRVPFLRRLLAHAFYLCQENMKLNVLFLFVCWLVGFIFVFLHLTVTFHLVSLTSSLSFGDIAEQHRSVQNQKCCRRCCRVSAIWMKSVCESFLLVSLSLLLWPTQVTKLGYCFRVEFVTGHLCHVGSSAHGWNGGFRYITLMSLRGTLWTSYSDIGVLCMLCICMAYLQKTPLYRFSSPVGLSHCWVSETLWLPVLM